MKLYVDKGLNFGSMTGFSITKMLQLTRHCQAVMGPKIDYSDGTHTLFL